MHISEEFGFPKALTDWACEYNCVHLMSTKSEAIEWESACATIGIRNSAIQVLPFCGLMWISRSTPPTHWYPSRPESSPSSSEGGLGIWWTMNIMRGGRGS